MDNFLKLVRIHTIPMSVSAFVLALCCALKAPFFIDFIFIANALLVLIAVVLVHMAANAFDDYIDVKRQIKSGLNINNINFNKNNKARPILEGVYSLNCVRNIIIALLLPPFLIGIYFALFRGNIIYFYMLLALAITLFYPFSSKYGLSEICVGVLFGPILINAVHYALTGQYNIVVFNFSIASGLMTSILLITHSLMDFEFDVQNGKKTLPVLLGDKNLTINIISLTILLSYFILVYTCIKYEINKFILLPVVATFLIAYKLVLSLYDYIKVKNVQFCPKWYLGRMENWNEILKNGTAYFMFRFYLARNLAAVFNYALAVAALFVFYPMARFDFFDFRFYV